MSETTLCTACGGSGRVWAEGPPQCWCGREMVALPQGAGSIVGRYTYHCAPCGLYRTSTYAPLAASPSPVARVGEAPGA